MLFLGEHCRDGLDPDRHALFGQGASTVIKQVKEDIQARYDNGQPFFTKDALRAVRDQLKQYTENGQKITVKGIDGVPVQWMVETGRVSKFYRDFETGHFEQSDEPNDPDDYVEFVWAKPFIRYYAYQWLLHYPKPAINMHVAYSNVRLYHRSVFKHPTTSDIPHQDDACPSKAEARDFFEENMDTWEGSKQYELLLSFLLSKKEYFQKGGVSNIIGLGCGTFTGSVKPEDKPRASVQHALLLTLRDFLGDVLDNVDHVKILAQDPAYTDTDTEVLKEYEITTLDDPDGFLELDDQSIVVSCSPTAPVKQIVADICRPLMWICDTVTTLDDLQCTDPDSSRVRNLITKHYDITDFPQDPVQLGHVDDFGPVSVYVRRPEN